MTYVSLPHGFYTLVKTKNVGGGKGEEMTQTLYAHMNKRKKNIKNVTQFDFFFLTVFT
jgi:hypothetical protein